MYPTTFFILTTRTDAIDSGLRRFNRRVSWQLWCAAPPLHGKTGLDDDKGDVLVVVRSILPLMVGVDAPSLHVLCAEREG